MIDSACDDGSESGFDFRSESERFIRLSNTDILFIVSYHIVSFSIEKSVTSLTVLTSNREFDDYKKFDIIFSRVKITSDTSHD